LLFCEYLKKIQFFLVKNLVVDLGGTVFFKAHVNNITTCTAYLHLRNNNHPSLCFSHNE